MINVTLDSSTLLMFSSEIFLSKTLGTDIAPRDCEGLKVATADYARYRRSRVLRLPGVGCTICVNENDILLVPMSSFKQSFNVKLSKIQWRSEIFEINPYINVT